MSADNAEALISKWKKIADKQLLNESPYQNACRHMSERGLCYRVKLVMPSLPEHKLHAWGGKLLDFIACYGFDVNLEEDMTVPPVASETDLYIIFPLNDDAEVYCLELAKDKAIAARLIVCIPDGHDGKLYCRLLREVYFVLTLPLPIDELTNFKMHCNFGVQLIRHSANSMMNKATVSIRELRLQNTVVVLMHGIRTRALWQSEIRHTLEQKGLVAIPTNYGKFDVIRFLLPLTWIKQSAVRRVMSDINATRSKFPDAQIDIIAHSFGTFITGIFLSQTKHKIGRVALCGSILPSSYDFSSVKGKYSMIVNEVGCSDIWPVLAAKLGFGYGPTGSFGFNRGDVKDRYHTQLSHSSFLNAAFCNNYWVPYFCDGKVDETGLTTPKPSRMVRFIDNLPPLKWLFLGAIFVVIFFACKYLWLSSR